MGVYIPTQVSETSGQWFQVFRLKIYIHLSAPRLLHTVANLILLHFIILVIILFNDEQAINCGGL